MYLKAIVISNHTLKIKDPKDQVVIGHSSLDDIEETIICSHDEYLLSLSIKC